MDEDKINSDISDKRKIEEDNPKPNPKRIKLVRPVFSPVVKPVISTLNENKSDVQSTEILKSSHSPTNVVNVVNTSQSSEKNVFKNQSETIVKPIEQPTTVKQSIELSETVKNPIEQSDTVKKSFNTPEIINKSVVIPHIPEEQTDNSSDALDIPNIFSEETKKELEDLKKNIFKIDDDGSSSENDSQSKRPRLKRPTFVTSATENKVESYESKSLDKTNEVCKFNVVKSVGEENISITDTITDKNSCTERNTDKITENITENINVSKLEQNNTVIENIIENKLIISESLDNVLKDKCTVTKNIKSVEEEKLTFPSVDCLVEKEIIKKKIIEKESLSEIPKNVEIIQDNTKIKQKVIKNDNNEQYNVEKEMIESLVEKKSIDKDIINQTTKEQNIKINVLNEKQIILKDKIHETVGDNSVVKNLFKDNFRVVLERYIDKKSNAKIENEKASSSINLDYQNKSGKNITETIKTKSIEEHTEDNKNEEEASIDTDIKCIITNINEDKQINSTVQTIKNIEDTTLENVKQKSYIDVQFHNEKESSYDMLSSSTDTQQKYEDHESQIFKSDILKAALMSKKSPESIINSSEVHDPLNTNSYPISSETKQIEVLPKIGQDAIVNKIEAEIKLSINDQSANNTKSQNEHLSNVLEINNSNETSSSICLKDNSNVDNNDEPPKWGSAKMNEVEKFLNDSNVTITPICKSQEIPKLGKITLKLPKVGNPEIKPETPVRPDVKSELIKKITNKQIAMGDSPLKSVLPQPSKSFSDFATIRPAPKPSAEQIALLEQQILSTPKKRGRPPKALAQQKQLLLQYQQQQQHKVIEGGSEAGDETVFHVPLFDMEDMSGGAAMFDSFDASTPKRAKGIRGKGSRGRRGRGGLHRGRDGSDSDTASKINHIDDKVETYHEEMDQDEETKQVAIIEAERLRKEEARERKLEERKKKLKLRNDILKEKKLKKKQKAEERRLQWHEKKRLMQEERAKAAEMKKSLPPPQNFDDETRMSADCNNSRSQTPARHFMIGEDDLSISGTTNDSIRMKKGRMEVIDLESNKTLTVDQIAEYQWPLEGGELYMIQEQISNFLGVKSFKRKYPSLKRRNVEAEERTFLCDSGLVAESLCDLGLTVLYSSEVLDVMYVDFPEKYEELREYMRLKHAKELSNRQRALMTISSNTDGSKLDLRDRAMEAVANWNVSLNKSRLESRKCSMDMQTFIVHYPKNKCKKMTVPKSKIGNYPLALLPGQFCDYYATYSSEDLRYLPMNTVMYGPLKSVDKDFPVSLSSQSESEDSSSDDSSDSDDSIDVDNKLGKNGLEYGPSDKKGAECKLCLGTAEKNKKGTIEPLIHCSKCLTIYHPTCLDMTLEMVPYIKRYNWQCNECKSCAQCKEVADEDKMLFCDLCDRGYHIYCVGLRRVPEGRWHCQVCAMCSSCGVSDPGPGDSKWFYEFKKIEKTGSKVYCRTLCASCSRSWKKGHYCPNCMRCYPIKNVERMTQCNSCDRYLHSECISENVPNRQVVACNICEEKAVSRLLTTVPRSLIKV